MAWQPEQQTPGLYITLHNGRKRSDSESHGKGDNHPGGRCIPDNMTLLPPPVDFPTVTAIARFAGKACISSIWNRARRGIFKDQPA
jgi:hypothetical protein